MVRAEFFSEGAARKKRAISSVLREIARFGAVGSGQVWLVLVSRWSLGACHSESRELVFPIVSEGVVGWGMEGDVHGALLRVWGVPPFSLRQLPPKGGSGEPMVASTGGGKRGTEGSFLRGGSGEPVVASSGGGKRAAERVPEQVGDWDQRDEGHELGLTRRSPKGGGGEPVVASTGGEKRGAERVPEQVGDWEQRDEGHELGLTRRSPKGGSGERRAGCVGCRHVRPGDVRSVREADS